MKRNEMIAAIDNELIQRAVCESYRDGNGAWDSYKVAEFILDRIEEEGMRPPYDATQDDGVDTMEWESE